MRAIRLQFQTAPRGNLHIHTHNNSQPMM